MTSEAPNEPVKELSADEVNAVMSRRGVIRAAGAGALPQFTIEIDGVDIHFIHVK